MEKVEKGLFVRVAYKGTLENGEVFDNREAHRPLEIQMGTGLMIEGFEKALLGMSLNEKKVFTLEPEEAYGQRDEALVLTFARADIPPDIDPRLGQTLALNTPRGRGIPARVVRADVKSVTMDMNHPLAGKALTFEIEVVGISSSSTRNPAGCGPGCDCSSSSL